MKTHNLKTKRLVNGHVQVNKSKALLTLKYSALSCIFFILTTRAAMAQNSNLAVHITNLKNGKGVCRISLWSSAEGFPMNDKKAIKIAEAPVTGTTSLYVFENLPAGTYAVTIYDDENNNNKFDTNFLGIPKERYGDSNGARGGITGPPKFEKASFVHSKMGTSIEIKVE